VPDRALLAKIEKPPSVDDTAYLQIKQAILDCVLAPGESLVETRLAEELGVSRTPIRRAIARLEQEGFVVADPSKGYNVAGISQDDLAEMYELRAILECHLVRKTAERFSQEELAEIEAALQDADQALGREDYPSFLATNRKFHHAFDRKYGNQRISDVLANLDEHVYRAIMCGFRAQEGGVVSGLGYADHKLILEAIQRGDADSAVSLMGDHLRRGPLFLPESSAG
jgi:DNA-binding GntR family transcriptional regulator